MKKVKVLNLEDDAFKHAEIVRVLQASGVYDISWAGSLSEGLSVIRREAEAGTPFNLVITDMNYPDAPGKTTDPDAGEKAIAAASAEVPPIPTVVCSSIRYRIPKAAACIWYNPWGDWEGELAAWVKEFRRG